VKFVTNFGLGILGKPDDPNVWKKILSSRTMKRECKKAKRILVVAGGHGTEVDVLVELHGEEILTKIWFNELLVCFTNDVLVRYPQINIAKGDFVSLSFNMKFDVIIGNPPYQEGGRDDQANKLWPLFVKKAYDLVEDNGHVAMITPNGWMQPTADIGKGTGKNALSIFNDIFKKNNLILANIDSDAIRETHFKGVGSTFSYYLFQKAPYSGSTEFITSTGSVQIDISKIDSLPKVTSKESLSIVKKMVGTPFTFCDQNHGLNGVEGDSQGTVTVLKKIKGVEKALTHKLQYTIYHTNKNNGTYWFGETLNPYATTPKVIISLSGTYLPVFNNTTGFSNMCLAVICKTDEEAKRAHAVLTSKLYKFWVDMQKFSGFNPRKLILTLPELPLTTDWTEASICQHFGLTQEEIDYVEANVK
jgi:site-specific DNA-methyltransferase (adenine-specific)